MIVRFMKKLPALALTSMLSWQHQALAAQAENLEQVQSRIPSAPPGYKPMELPAQPLVYPTGEGFNIQVEAVARGLNHLWGFAQLPDGTILISERDKGLLRVIRNGQLDPQPVSGMPAVKANARASTGLLDIVLHPEFARNHYVYLTYNKPLSDEKSAMAIVRGEWDGKGLKNAKDIFVAPAGVSGASRILFDGKGHLFMSMYGGGMDAQDLKQLRGKVLRLTEDGKVPTDNPFVGKADVQPEIYTYGHRTTQGLLLHPKTGDIWGMEMGPNGGDKVSILKPGANYGWPLVSLGRDYAGPWQAKEFRKEGVEVPIVYWMPSISVSGMVLYSGDKIPKWQGDLLAGGLRMGEIPGTGQMQRIRFNGNNEEIRREQLLTDLHMRIRGAYQGSDGYLYAVTDEDDAVVLRIGAAP